MKDLMLCVLVFTLSLEISHCDLADSMKFFRSTDTTDTTIWKPCHTVIPLQLVFRFQIRSSGRFELVNLLLASKHLRFEKKRLRLHTL